MKNRHILFIVENNPAPPDARVWNEALAAREFGYEVSVIGPRDNLRGDNRRVIKDIQIYRHPRPRERSGKFPLILEYLNAAFWELLLSIRVYLNNPFQVIHGANPPDHIFLIAILFKLTGVKYIFDHHDITPENYAAKFGSKGIIYRLLLIMEWLTFKSANLVVSTNESYANIAKERGGKQEKDIIVVRNGPDLSRIPSAGPNPKLREGFQYLVGYVGVIGQQEGIENLLTAVRYIVEEKKRNDIKFIIVGPGPHLNAVRNQAKEMQLDRYVKFTGYIPKKELVEVLTTADVCINPEYANEFTDKSTMIKVMEYMAFGKPIIQFYTKEGEVTAGEAAIYIRENNAAKFADAIIDLLDDPARRKKMGEIGKYRISEMFGWAIQKQHLREAYNRVLHE